MEINVKSVYLVTRALLPLLLQRHGSIVNIGSVAGLVGIKQRFAYCTTKGAVVAMTRQLAIDYPKELRVNCICPGMRCTHLLWRAISKNIMPMKRTRSARS